MVRVGQGFLTLLVTVLAGMLAISLMLNVYLAFFRSLGQSGIKAPLEFNFSWSPDSQEIINGTFRLGVKMWIDGDNVTIVATANDDDYNDADYVGLVFDTNQNGYVDVSDESFVMFADNETIKSNLEAHGFLSFVQLRPERGPQNVTFNSDTGYTFIVQFPFYSYSLQYDPAKAIKEGQNQLHVCFKDQDAEDKMKTGKGVFARLVFLAGGV